jgi:hypothetical protein
MHRILVCKRVPGAQKNATVQQHSRHRSFSIKFFAHYLQGQYHGRKIMSSRYIDRCPRSANTVFPKSLLLLSVLTLGTLPGAVEITLSYTLKILLEVPFFRIKNVNYLKVWIHEHRLAQWYNAWLRPGWSGVQDPAGAGNFSLNHSVQTSSGAHTASYPMGTRGSFSGSKAAGA